LRDIVKNPRNNKSQRAALNAISMMPEKDDHGLLAGMLTAKDDRERASGAEGLGRLGDSADVPQLEKLWKDEEKMAPRLAAAFGLVMSGRVAATEDTPLWYLVSTLNSGPWRDTALAYLVEAARKNDVRNALYPAIERGTRSEKTGLALVLASSGDSGSVAYLDKLSRDTDEVAAQDGLKALRSLHARLGQ
jgi:HEAT repeat protein